MSEPIIRAVYNENARLVARQEALNVTDFLLECSRLFPYSDHEIPLSAWNGLGAILGFLRSRIEVASPEEEVRHV